MIKTSVSPLHRSQSWSLLSVSKLLSIGAHGADWGWMPTAVTPQFC